MCVNDNDDDDEPPTISTSPQEFLYRLQQRQQQQQNGRNDNDGSDNSNSSSNSSSRYDNNSETSPSLPSAAARQSPWPPPPQSSSLPRSGFDIHKYNNKYNNIDSNINNMIGRKAGGSIAKAIYVCTNCQSEYVQWVGKCNGCQEYNTIVQEYRAAPRKSTANHNNNPAAVIAAAAAAARGGRFNKSSSPSTSWLDGISTFAGAGDWGGVGGRGAGPVRVTDVYQDMMLLDESSSSSSSSSWMEAYKNGSLKERRTIIPDDPELNAVLGGGLMPGSITLVGGDPGMSLSLLIYLRAHDVFAFP